MYKISTPSGRCSNFVELIKLHGLSMFAVTAKLYGVLYNQPSSIAFDETVIDQRKKLLISRLFIGHHTVVWFPFVSIS